MRHSSLICLGIVLTALALQAGVREQFADPPPDCKLQAWYHWTTTGISDKCLAADLKAMGELGVGTAHVFMPGQQTLPPETQPLDPEWWRRWETAIAEAKKNGLQLGFHNCPGWSSSGGKWIKPEDSMKMLVACATDVSDLSKPVSLAQPRAFHDFYRDVAVYAFPIERPAVPTKVSGSFAADFEAFRTGKGVLTLPTDRKDPPNCEVVFEYAAPIAPTSLVTTWDESQFHLDIEVLASVDGATWTRVAFKPYRLFNTQLTPKVLPLAKMTPSRFFKLSVKTVQPPVWVGFIRRKLARVEFSNLPLVDDLDGKNGASVAHGYRHPDDPAAPGLAKSSIVDVTAAFKDGVLDLPSHPLPQTSNLKHQTSNSSTLYRILRVGFTTTGKCCAPAPGNVRGLECDKLSKRGLDAHWPHMPHKMINAPGGKGTVKVAIVDSWEVGGQNWTDEFPSEFRRRRGYDIRPWLPAMAGYVVGTAGETARFLYDVQRTVSDLLCENYYDYFAEKCRAEGVLSATESYGGPFDSLRAFCAADVPTGEFWLGRVPHGSPRVAASAGHLNGRLRIGAEAFTTEAKEGRWQITPHELRVNGDRGWLDGISQLVYHSYLQQPFDNVQPGFSLDRHGTQFNRHTTWWPEGKWWAKYVHRGQFLLQRGEPKADVLVFAGDSTPNAYSYQAETVAAGYNFDYCGPRDLERLEARDGGVAMPGRLTYEVLWLGNDRFLSCAALRKIQTLLAGGARIAGRRPVGTPTLMDDPAAWKTLVDEIWNGKYPNLKSADSSLKALVAFGIRAPMEAGGSLKASRRVIEGRDFYFVVNGGDAFDGAVSFKAQGRPERWDCKTGRIEPLAWYADETGRVKTRLALAKDESMFVSFRAPVNGEAPKALWDGPVVEEAVVAIVSARYEARDDAKLGLDVTEKVRALLANGKTFHVGNDVLKVRDPASNHYKVLRVDWTADGEARHNDFAEHGDASFRVTRRPKVPEQKVLMDVSCDWTITSFKGKNPPAAPLKLATLVGWNASADEKLKYFAGRAVYEKRIALGGPGLETTQKGTSRSATSVCLDLGDVRELVNVWVNGEFLGCLWEAPYRVEIPVRMLGDAQKTLNLRLEVVNTWPNRLIGDAKARKAGAAEPRGKYGVPEWVLADKPDSGTGIFTWMNWMKGWTADDEPRPAGLLGPVRLVAVPSPGADTSGVVQATRDASVTGDDTSGVVRAEEAHRSFRAQAAQRIAAIRATSNRGVPEDAPKYYLSAKTGDDASDGRTPKTAWRTSARLGREKLAPGSVVLFERGGVYRGSVRACAGVTYTAYGTGAKPCVYGSPEDGADPAKWRPTENPRVWAYDIGHRDVGTLVFDGGARHAIKIVIRTDRKTGETFNKYTGRPFNSYRDLDGDLHFWHDYYEKGTGKVYLYSERNPGERFRSIEFNVKCSGFSVGGACGVTIDNFTVKYVGVHGVSAGTCKDLTVSNCEFGWIGGSIQAEAIFGRDYPTRLGNAVEIYGGCENYAVTNCYMWQVYDAGVTQQYNIPDSMGTKRCDQRNIRYAGNVFEKCNYSVEYFLTAKKGNWSRMENFVIEDNLMFDAGLGFCEQRPDRNTGAHIKAWRHPERNRAFNYVVRRNLFCCSGDMLVQICSGLKNEDGSSSLPTLTDNVFIGRVGDLFGEITDTAGKGLVYGADSQAFVDRFGTGNRCLFLP